VAITFADGSSVIEGFVAHRTMTAPDTRLARMLGAELAPSGELVVGWKAKQTSVHGVFAAGDAAAHMKSVPTAQQDGMFAAWGLAMQVEAERLGHDDVDFADR
jgi:thioredoxin reductase